MTLFISPLVHAENIKPEHGMAMYGDLKYDSDFEHFDYTNPDAPKGGELRQHVVGTFDSLNGFILKGNPASGLSMIYDTLMVSSDDEPFSMYGLVAKSVERAPDNTFVRFNLNKDAKYPVAEVVTQNDNYASINLYQSLGFQLIGQVAHIRAYNFNK